MAEIKENKCYMKAIVKFHKSWFKKNIDTIYFDTFGHYLFPREMKYKDTDQNKDCIINFGTNSMNREMGGYVLSNYEIKYKNKTYMTNIGTSNTVSINRCDHKGKILMIENMNIEVYICILVNGDKYPLQIGLVKNKENSEDMKFFIVFDSSTFTHEEAINISNKVIQFFIINKIEMKKI